MNSIIYQELLKLSDTQTDNFKKRAYKNAANAIKNIKHNINSIDDIQNVKGIGKGSIEKIKIILLNGTLNLDDSIINQNDTQFLIEKLSKIYGVGEKQAIKISKSIVNFEDVYKNEDLLNNKQKIGLKYYNDLQKRIPRNEIDHHNEIINNIWINLKIPFTYEIVGSYRRNKPDSGDIDILLTFPKNSPKNFKLLVQSLIDNNYIIENLAYGAKKFMGISKLENTFPARRIDIIYCTKEEYPYCLLYFTGSGEYNRGMRDFCKKKGLKLNEKGLISLNNEMNINFIPKNEKDIFDFLKIKYVNPEDRISFCN